MFDTMADARRRIRERVIPAVGALIVFIVSFSVLYAGENVGLSDNGDFRRVLLTNNIEYKNEADKAYLFTEYYTMDLDGAEGVLDAVAAAWRTNEGSDLYSSPQFLIIKLSKELNVIANAISGGPITDYDIVYLALIYIFMLSAAAWVIFSFFADSSPKLQALVFGLFIFVFCDAGYLLYFNSFYGEALQYTSLMALIAFGMLIYKRPSVPKAIGFFISLYFFAGSKLANIPYSLIAAMLSIFIIIMRRDKLFKAGVIAAALVCIVNMIGLYESIPDWMTRDTTYQSVFYGVLRQSPDAAAELEELGTSGEYAALADTHAYMDEDEYVIDRSTDEFKTGFYDKVSKLDIAFFYMRHPVRFVRELSLAIENSAYIRPPGQGNSAYTKMVYTNKFSGWSKLRITLRFLYEPWVIFSAFIILTLYMIFMNVFYIRNHKIETPRRRYMICALDVLLAGLWINLFMPVLCNGECDLPKHMFLFTNCIDILFFVCVVSVSMLPPRRAVSAAVCAALFTGLFYVEIPRRTVEFGTLGGKPVKWYTANMYNDGTSLLITKDCIGYMPFDDNSNDWETSDLRRYLNGGFLDEFTAAERGRIMPVTNEIYLTTAERERAVAGTHSFYWNCTRSMAGDLSKTAYHYYLEDKVYIPTFDMLEALKGSDSYWMLCPYVSNSYMERFMNKDGFVLHTDVKNENGVRAVIRIINN